jgi:hypothetical protein
VKLLNVFCEGPTEQAFCNQVLQPHLFPQGDGQILTLAVGQKNHRHIYGIGTRTPYVKVRKFIRNLINGRAKENVFFTTLFDLYALPNDFPGKDANVRNPADPTPYVVALENAFREDVNHSQFIPHLQLHEFETILFAEPEAFAVSFEDCNDEIQQLKDIAASVQSIELINDSKDTAPSKRIIAIVNEYAGRKSTAGPDIAEYIGLSTIRGKCPHFHEWLLQLENLNWQVE